MPKYYTPFNEDIYIAGTFNSWSPNANKLTRISNSLFRIQLNLATGAHEFKFTRGLWASGECNTDGSMMANRKVQVGSTAFKLVLKVNNWDDFKVNNQANIFLV